MKSLKIRPIEERDHPLLERLFGMLREAGWRRTSLSVQQDNPAVRFYQRLGYVIVDERPDGAGHEDYLMIKVLC